MAEIYIENVNVKNLYFGGVNDFASEEETFEEEETTSTFEDEGEKAESDTIQIDPDNMAKAISVIEGVDIDTVEKVLGGARQFLASAAKMRASTAKMRASTAPMGASNGK